MKKILVVGKGLIGNAIKTSSKYNILLISHFDIDNLNFSDIDIVINTALHPDYRKVEYNQHIDFDRKLSMMCEKNNCHYIMFSSRKVYGNTKDLTYFSETSEYNPFDHYSENKVITEKFLTENIENVTILRGSNFFGKVNSPDSFVGYCMENLYEKRTIPLTICPDIIRDFIYVDDVVEILDKILYAPINGIFNLGLNCGFSVKKIANDILEGYAAGEIVYHQNLIKDQQFILNCSKLYTSINYNPDIIKYNYIFKFLGWMLNMRNLRSHI